MKIRNVCLVNTPARSTSPVSRSMMGGLGFGTDEHMMLPPLDLLVMAAVLRDEGRQVQLLDPDAQGLDKAACIEGIRAFGAQSLVALVSLPTLESDCDWIREVSEASGVPCHVKSFIRQPPILAELLEKSGAISVIIGEPDFALGKILEGEERSGTAYLDGGEVRLHEYQPIEDLDALPFAARDMLSQVEYAFPHLGRRITTMQTSRGCPYPCGYYCPYPMVEGKKWRPMTPERIAAEMQAIADAGLYDGVLFRDATFTLQRERTLEMCSRIVAAGVKLDWWCETRIDRLDEEMLGAMREAGCRGINVGVESGNEAMISTIGKKGLTLDNLARVREQARRLGIHLHFLMQVGLPGETRETMLDTLDLLRRVRPDSIGMTHTTPYPGTQLYEDAIANQWIGETRWQDFDAHTPIMRVEALTTDELAFGREMILSAYWQNQPEVSERRKREFYVEALRWVYRLDDGDAEERIRAALADPAWKTALRPVWRLLPLRARKAIRKSLANLSHQTV